MAALTFDGMKDMVGQELGVSSWVTVDQKMINAFAETTGDRQWIHIDVERAKRESPFRAPIAHGYLTLSLAAKFMPELIDLPTLKMGVNYGCEKVRFPSPVKVGQRIRGNGQIVAVERTKDGSVQSTLRLTVEVEGQDKPACVVDTVSRYYF